ncbi:hypothetical protein A0H81_12709 [Grifola frondosa]|uniref:Uncharacterized protein n=1 Tax=Grifola frondosa TaxID=5627 RepID=A0A1C7LRE3_GRIFR|nr:hypothetical protein A0H81_12709 [Grifola frondosa]
MRLQGVSLEKLENAKEQWTFYIVHEQEADVANPAPGDPRSDFSKDSPEWQLPSSFPALSTDPVGRTSPATDSAFRFRHTQQPTQQKPTQNPSRRSQLGRHRPIFDPSSQHTECTSIFYVQQRKSQLLQRPEKRGKCRQRRVTNGSNASAIVVIVPEGPGSGHCGTVRDCRDPLPFAARLGAALHAEMTDL